MPPRTHGHTIGQRSKTYKCWTSIIDRCENARCTMYRYYGARGIQICTKWRASFQAFLADMGEVPSGRQIERINSRGNYEPTNCRWATRSEQQRNKSSNRIISFDGRRACIAEWAEITKLPYGAIYQRVRDGWPPKEALTTPLRIRNR